VSAAASDVRENAIDDVHVGEDRDRGHRASAPSADHRIDLQDPAQVPNPVSLRGLGERVVVLLGGDSGW